MYSTYTRFPGSLAKNAFCYWYCFDAYDANNLIIIFAIRLEIKDLEEEKGFNGHITLFFHLSITVNISLSKISIYNHIYSLSVPTLTIYEKSNILITQSPKNIRILGYFFLPIFCIIKWHLHRPPPPSSNNINPSTNSVTYTALFDKDTKTGLKIVKWN